MAEFGNHGTPRPPTSALSEHDTRIALLRIARDMGFGGNDFYLRATPSYRQGVSDIMLHHKDVIITVSLGADDDMAVSVRACKSLTDHTGGQRNYLPLKALFNTNQFCKYVSKVIGSKPATPAPLTTAIATQTERRPADTAPFWGL